MNRNIVVFLFVPIFVLGSITRLVSMPWKWVTIIVQLSLLVLQIGLFYHFRRKDRTLR